MTAGSPFTADQKDRLVGVLRDTASVAYACAAVGISRSTFRRHLEIDVDFASAVADAEEDAADALELEARRRAMEGEIVKVVRDRHGNVIHEERKKSDALAMFLLKGRRRHVFGDTSKVDMTSSDGSMSPSMGDVEASARIASFLAIAARRQVEQETGVAIPENGSGEPEDGSELL